MSLRQIVCLGLIWMASVCIASAQEPPKDEPAPPASPPALTRIRVGGTVQQAKILHLVQPEYPADAKKKGIQGTVLLHAIVGKEGAVSQLEAVSGPPELRRAAMDAVKQWRYRPSILKGNPVEVDTTIAVVFTLSGKNGTTPP